MQSFAELSSKEKVIEVVRWLCVLPAAWLAGMAPRFLVALIRPPVMAQLPGTPRPPVSDFQRIYLPLLIGILMAGAFVVVGAKIAPRRRVLVAIVLAAFWTLYVFTIHVLLPASYEPRYVARHFISAAAAVAAAVYIWHSESSKRM